MSKELMKRKMRCCWAATLVVATGVFVASPPGVARAQQACASDIECDDGDVCTDETCIGGACVYVNNSAPCDDGLFCTATDTCAGGICVGAGDPCLALGQVCDASGDACTDTLARVTIENLYMTAGTTADLIVSGQLAGYEAYSVSALPWILPQSATGFTHVGNVAFTAAPPTDIIQLADPWLGSGVFQIYDTDCFGGPNNSYNAAVIYDPALVPSPVLFSGPLMRFPVTASADAHGAWMVFNLDSQGWYPNGLPSASTYASLITVFPVTCVTDAECDDGFFCNGAETCVGGACRPGPATSCDDGVACTRDGCDWFAGVCTHDPLDASCDNGLFCDGAETCDPVLDCLPGTPADCNDGIDCTADSCDEATASCQNVADDTLCDNGIYCDGAETCDAAIGCVWGNDPCVDQLCDEAAAACVDCFTDADCDDAIFCNGAELCTTGACQSGGDPCPGQTCDEATATCFDALTGEGFILSRNPDYSTDDREFTTGDTIYMLVWSDQVDYNDIRKAKWELKDRDGEKVKRDLTNNFDGSYTASFDLADLPSNGTSWTWKAEVKDDAHHRYKPRTGIAVLP